MKIILIFFRVAASLISLISLQWKCFKLARSNRCDECDAIVSNIVPLWARQVFTMFNKKIAVTVTGAELIPADTAVVFVANHQGALDIPLLLGYIDKPKAFIAKIELLKIPLLSGWMKLMKCTFLARKNPRQSIAAMAEAVETVKKGNSLVIFPEGHRSKGGPMQEFKAGSFKLAFRAGVPIVPVTIDGTWRLFEDRSHHSMEPVLLTIHPPVYTEGLSKEALAAIPSQVQKTVESALRS